MSYFWGSVVRDRRVWLPLLFVAVLLLNILDILSYSFAAPGYFNLWVNKASALLALGGLIGYGAFLRRRETKFKRIDAMLPDFITARRAEIERRVSEDPGFQTFCFDCCHFDSVRRGCRLHLFDCNMKVKLKPTDRTDYCLYWNADHPLLLTSVARPDRLDRE